MLSTPPVLTVASRTPRHPKPSPHRHTQLTCLSHPFHRDQTRHRASISPSQAHADALMYDDRKSASDLQRHRKRERYPKASLSSIIRAAPLQPGLRFRSHSLSQLPLLLPHPQHPRMLTTSPVPPMNGFCTRGVPCPSIHPVVLPFNVQRHLERLPPVRRCSTPMLGSQRSAKQTQHIRRRRRKCIHQHNHHLKASASSSNMRDAERARCPVISRSHQSLKISRSHPSYAHVHRTSTAMSHPRCGVVAAPCFMDT